MNNNANAINSESQNVSIARYLEEGGSLTPLEALDLFGCFRLAARIGELRGQGMNIERRDIPVMNSKGRTVYIGEYYLGAAE